MIPERRRLTYALLLSLLIHTWLLSLTFGGQGLWRSGFGFPWQDRRIEAPDLRVALVPAPVTAGDAAVTPVVEPSQQASVEQPVASRPARKPSVSRAPIARLAPAGVSEAKPKAEAKPKKAAASGAATAKAPLRADRSRNTAPTPSPAPAVIALERTDEDTWVVPVTPAMPPPVTAAAPSISIPQTAMPSVRDVVDAALARIDQEAWERPVELAKRDSSNQEGQRQAEQQEAAREDTGREEATRAENARLETERQEAARQAAARQEAARREAARRAAAQQEAQRQEAARRKEAARVEAARREAERQEAARQEVARQEEAARVEAVRREVERQEARLAAAQQEAQRQEVARQEEAARVEAARREAERQDAARRAAAQQEAQRQEVARQEEAARVEAAQREAERQEAARVVAAQEAQRQEVARQEEAARVEAGRREAERQQAARVRVDQEEAEKREARLRAIGRQLDEEAARRDAAMAAPRLSPSLPPPSWSPARRYRLFGRTDPNQEIILYAEAWERKIQLNMTFDMVREAAKQPHTDPLVTVAIRSDGSVEKVTFVLSSGVAAIDDAIRRIVDSQKPYQAFPPSLASEYDVLEIRRTWYFDMAIRLY